MRKTTLQYSRVAGDNDGAYRDAAKAAILLEPSKKQPKEREQLSKALFRKGTAQAAKGALAEACSMLSCHRATEHLPQVREHRVEKDRCLSRYKLSADQLPEALDSFRAAAKLAKDPALRRAIRDVLEEMPTARVVKVR